MAAKLFAGLEISAYLPPQSTLRVQSHSAVLWSVPLQ